MRALALCCALAACASFEPTRPPPERLTGCWENREAIVARMRWQPDGARADALAGHLLVYGQAGVRTSARFTLEPSEAGWSFCELDAAGAASRCWRVAEGQGGSLEGGRVFIDASGERIRISLLGDGPERVIFHGRRDSCD